MIHLSINGTQLLLPASTKVQVEHVNPLFADGIEDSFSLPIEVPAEGNEVVLEHVHQLPLAQRTLTFQGAALGQQGSPLFPGVLTVLSTTPRSVRATFSVEAFLQHIRGLSLPDALGGETIDLLDELINHSTDFRTRPNHAAGGKCQFPMFLAPDLFGNANPDWAPDASDWNATSTYAVDQYAKYIPLDSKVRRARVYQCIDATTAGQSPDTHPAKWLLTAFSIVNAWDRANNNFYFNTAGNFYTFCPWFYLLYVLKRAVASVGYTVIGDFVDDPATQELLLPNTTTIDRDAEPHSAYGFKASQPTTVYYGGGHFRVPADDDSTGGNFDTSDMWDTGWRWFIPPVAGVYKIRLDTLLSHHILPNRHITGNSSGPGAAYTNMMRLALLDYDLERQGVYRFIGDRITTDGMGPGDDASSRRFHTEITATVTPSDVGRRFFLALAQAAVRRDDPTIAQKVWPTRPGWDFMKDTHLLCWLEEAAPTIVRPDDTITVNRHVPDVPLEGFLMALADAFNLEVVPDVATRTVRMDYRERLLEDPHRHTTDQSPRQVGEVEIDHQRALPGLSMRWDLDGTTAEPPNQLLGLAEYDSELDLPAPDALGLRAVVRNTRMVFKSGFKQGRWFWEEAGYHVPPETIGAIDGAREVVPGCKPVHMVHTTLDGHDWLMPVMEGAGTSAWWHTQGDRGTIWLCEFKRMRSYQGGTGATNVPGARSWGLGWDGDDRSAATLLLQPAHAELPGHFSRYWRRWAQLLTTAEPVTMDLLVDIPYLRSAQWRRIHHIHGQHYLVQRLPADYGAHSGNVFARGAHLLRLRPGPAVPAPPPPACTEPNSVRWTMAAPGTMDQIAITSGYWNGSGYPDGAPNWTLRDDTGATVVGLNDSIESSIALPGTDFVLYPSTETMDRACVPVAVLFINQSPVQHLYLANAWKLRIIQVFDCPVETVDIISLDHAAVIVITDAALTETTVDRIINAAVPGVCTVLNLSGGTSSPRSSDSDVRFGELGTAGCTITLNP